LRSAKTVAEVVDATASDRLLVRRVKSVHTSNNVEATLQQATKLPVAATVLL